MANTAGATDLLGNVPYGKLALGILNTVKGFQGLRELRKKPVPQYGETAELRDSRFRANDMAKGGFTAPENAAYDQQYARSQNTAYNRAMQTAPNMASAINAGINYQNVNAINQRAVADAQLHRQNIHYADTFSKYLQDLNNRNVAEQLEQRKLATMQMGEAAQSGLTGIADSLTMGQALTSLGKSPQPPTGTAQQGATDTAPTTTNTTGVASTPYMDYFKSILNKTNAPQE